MASQPDKLKLAVGATPHLQAGLLPVGGQLGINWPKMVALQLAPGATLVDGIMIIRLVAGTIIRLAKVKAVVIVGIMIIQQVDGIIMQVVKSAGTIIKAVAATTIIAVATTTIAAATTPTATITAEDIILAAEADLEVIAEAASVVAAVAVIKAEVVSIIIAAEGVVIGAVLKLNLDQCLMILKRTPGVIWFQSILIRWWSI